MSFIILWLVSLGVKDRLHLVPTYLVKYFYFLFLDNPFYRAKLIASRGLIVSTLVTVIRFKYLYFNEIQETLLTNIIVNGA